MANLDTAAKRLSGINVGSPWRPTLPFPDGTIAQGDRQTLALLYSGILITGLVYAGTTTATLYLSLRLVSGIYTATGVTPSVDLTNKRPRLPDARVPIATANKHGQFIVDESWYRWMKHVEYERLGGPTGPNLPDIETSVTVVQEQAATVAASQTGIVQLATQNAEAGAAAREVLQTAALPGADQIPEYQRTPGIQP
jgi:hypothetical protein